MTDNIQKLYEIAGVYLCNMPDVDCDKECDKCEDYNQFTVKKQLELIKLIQLLDNIDSLQMFHHELNNRWCFIVEMLPEFSNIPTERLHCSHEQFEQALASLIIELWQDLSANQKQEIKDILQ